MKEELDRLIAAGYLARREHRLEEALALFTQATERSRPVHRAELAQALAGLGQIERDLGKGDAALQHYHESVQILRGLNVPLRLAHTVRHVADILHSLQRSAEAQPYYEEALTIYTADPETGTLDLGNTLAGYARCQEALGHPAAARALWAKALEAYNTVGVSAGIDEANRRLCALGPA